MIKIFIPVANVVLVTHVLWNVMVMCFTAVALVVLTIESYGIDRSWCKYISCGQVQLSLCSLTALSYCVIVKV